MTPRVHSRPPLNQSIQMYHTFQCIPLFVWLVLGDNERGMRFWTTASFSSVGICAVLEKSSHANQHPLDIIQLWLREKCKKHLGYKWVTEHP